MHDSRVQPARLATTRLGRVVARVAACAALALGGTAAWGQDDQLPMQVRGLDVEEHLGRELPRELDFVRDDGRDARLGEYFSDNRPAIVLLAYYDCPMVCTVVMEKLGDALNKVDLTVGKDFRVLVFSFKPQETTDQAARWKAHYASSYNRGEAPEIREGWQFHTTRTSTNVRTLADAIGFKYRLLDDGEYAHPVAYFVATPDGKIARYFYGYQNPEEFPRNLKLALTDASSGRLAKSIGDKLLAFCYMYDPKKGSYTLKAIRVMQVGGVLTLVALGTLIAVLLAGERLVKRRRAAAAMGAAGRGEGHRVVVGGERLVGGLSR